MADVFISYARAERDDAERIARQLEALGLSVFLDVDGLDGGDVFSEKLDREVKTSGAVLGLWLPLSLSRPWVQIECNIGKHRGVLIPAAIRPFEPLSIPAPFWDVQYVDLTKFKGDPNDRNWLKLLKSLARTLKRPELLAKESSSAKHDVATQHDLQKELERLRAELAEAKGEPPNVAPIQRRAAHTSPKRQEKSAAPLLAGIALSMLVGGIGGLVFADPFGWRQIASTSTDPADAGSADTLGANPIAAAPALASPANSNSTISRSEEASTDKRVKSDAAGAIRQPGPASARAQPAEGDRDPQVTPRPRPETPDFPSRTDADRQAQAPNAQTETAATGRAEAAPTPAASSRNAGAAAASASNDPAVAEGAVLYEARCLLCHLQGVANAPLIEKLATLGKNEIVEVLNMPFKAALVSGLTEEDKRNIAAYLSSR